MRSMATGVFDSVWYSQRHHQVCADAEVLLLRLERTPMRGPVV